jgi:hypothetical protein
VNAPTNLEPELRKEVEAVLAASKRAKRRAEDLAISTGTKLVESEDGKVVFRGPNEILARRKRAVGSERL